MTVEDDPVTTENEGVDGDEGKYLRVTVLYLDNAFIQKLQLGLQTTQPPRMTSRRVSV